MLSNAKDSITKQTYLFMSVVKWFIIALIIGTIVGAATALFLKLLKISTDFSNGYSFYYFSIPFVFVLCIFIKRTLLKDSEGHGTEKVIEAIHKRAGKLHILTAPVTLVTAILSIAAGGSAGKEGPSSQIGAGISSLFADLFRLSERDRRKVVICGISAGFSSVFGTPISGAIFGVEVLIVGTIFYDVLFPSLIAGIISYKTAEFFGITHKFYHIESTPSFSSSFLLYIVLAGIFFSIVGFLLIKSLEIYQTFLKKINLSGYIKGFIGGLILVGLALVFSNKYLGLGLNVIDSALDGNSDIVLYAFLLKILFTVITLNSGGSGGLLTPIFFIGSTAGILFATTFNLDRQLFAAIGLVSVLAGTTNTPIASSILFIELFGANNAALAALSSIISFILTGHRSVYPTQMLAYSKSSFLSIEKNRGLNDVNTRTIYKNSTLIRYYISKLTRLKNRILKKNKKL